MSRDVPKKSALTIVRNEAWKEDAYDQDHVLSSLIFNESSYVYMNDECKLDRLA